MLGAYRSGRTEGDPAVGAARHGRLGDPGPARTPRLPKELRGKVFGQRAVVSSSL